MLKTLQRQWHKVREGQSVRQIAKYYSVAERLLVKTNRLTGEPYAGQMLEIPEERGNVYEVKEGDAKAFLFGGEEEFRARNGTDVFYIGMRVILPKS